MQALWTCPKCGRAFANRNQFHFCSDVRLDDHFAGRDPQVIATFDALLAAAKKSGPVISPRNQVHLFRLHDPSEVDDEVERWLHEAPTQSASRSTSSLGFGEAAQL